jgi:hypothetical protein
MDCLWFFSNGKHANVTQLSCIVVLLTQISFFKSEEKSIQYIASDTEISNGWRASQTGS